MCAAMPSGKADSLRAESGGRHTTSGVVITGRYSDTFSPNDLYTDCLDDVERRRVL